MQSTSPLLTRLLLVTAILIGHSTSQLSAADLKTSIGPGGIGRYNRGHWGLLRGNVANRSDEDRIITAVVTPHGDSHARYVRSIRVPAKMSRDAIWPVYLPPAGTGHFEFDVLTLEGDQDSQNISELNTGDLTDTFVSVAPDSDTQTSRPFGNMGFCGLLASPEQSNESLITVDKLITLWRAKAGTGPMKMPVEPLQIESYPEGLDPLHQLLITATNLHHKPECCDAVRTWVQRGGRAVMFLDFCGENSATALLGDALTFAVVDRASSMVIELNHDSAGKDNRSGNLSHTRTFDEPVVYSRCLVEGGTTHWSVNGWPVVMEVTYGNGTFFVVNISPEVLLHDETGQTLDSCASQIYDLGFASSHDPPLASSGALAQAASQRLGYSIPQRQFSAIILGLFTLVAAAIAFAGWKKDLPSLVLAGIPILSIVAAIPGILKGNAARNQAPATVIEARIAHLAKGQATFAADGIATIYEPDVVTDSLTLPDNTALLPVESGSSVKQRLVWSDLGQSEWADFSQPAGATNYAQTSVIHSEKPPRAQAIFEADGVIVNLSHAESLNPEDIVIASSGPDRMSVRRLDTGRYSSSTAEVLSPGQYSNETMLSESQMMHAQVYDQVFTSENRLRRFPADASVLFWTNAFPASIQRSREGVRTETQTLVAIPLEFEKPEAGKEILIPPTLLPYRSVPGQDGSVSPAYSNRNSQWLPNKSATVVRLWFSIPSVCLPFKASRAELQLRILAGSRTVQIKCGSTESQAVIDTLESPVGSFEVSVPSEHLKSVVTDDGVLIEFHVSNLPNMNSDNEFDAERDDFWKIERVLLTLKGQRQQP